MALAAKDFGVPNTGLINNRYRAAIATEVRAGQAEQAALGVEMSVLATRGASAIPVQGAIQP